jgi:hypothetical protein
MSMPLWTLAEYPRVTRPAVGQRQVLIGPPTAATPLLLADPGEGFVTGAGFFTGAGAGDCAG